MDLLPELTPRLLIQWLYGRGDLHCRKKNKAKVLLSIRAHCADCNAVWRCPSSSALAALCCWSRAFTIGLSTLKDSLMWFSGLGLFRMLLCKPTSIQMKQWWVCSALFLWISYWNAAPRILEPCNSKEVLLIFQFDKPFLKIQVSKKHLTKLRGKLGICWRMFEYCQGTDGSLKCALCVFLLPVEREFHASKWKIVLFIVFHWIGLIKGFVMVSKAYILWFNTSWSSNLE